MIYILTGDTSEERNTYRTTLLGGRDSMQLSSSDASKEVLIEYARSVDLFGQSPCVICDNILHSDMAPLGVKDLELLQTSKSIFIFCEDVWKAADEKKYKKYALIKNFLLKKHPAQPKLDPFILVDSFARRDKVGAWILYLEAIDHGALPESLSGMLFWKIKKMILDGSRVFTPEELRACSSELVSLYHKAHKGERDFVIGLEQFILSSLSR